MQNGDPIFYIFTKNVLGRIFFKDANILNKIVVTCRRTRRKVITKKCNANDGKTRMCIIRNKFRGRDKKDNTININSYLIGVRDWEVVSG